MRDVSRFLGGLAMLVALLALSPAVAIGQGTPDNSHFDQYVPDYPGGEGDQAVGGGKGGGQGGSGQGNSLPPSNLEELRSTGPEGESAANFFEEAGIASESAAGQGDAAQKSQSTPKGDGGDDATSVNAVTADSQSALGTLLDTLAGDGEQGMGVVFPFLLGVIAAGGAAFVLRRRFGD
jgi:hypothetical protein